MSVKYSWNRQNGAAMPSVRFMSIEPAEDYYKGMPLKLKEKGIVEPTDGDPEYICMAEYNPDAEIQPLEIPVQEVFPDVVYDRMNDDGTIEEVRFGSKGGGVSEEQLTEAIDEVKEMISETGAQSDLSETDSNSKAYVKGKLQERHIPDSLARKDEIPTTPQEVGAEPTGTAETAVSTHNTAPGAHNDIRLLIEGLTTRLNTIANSTDVDLDQLAEIVAYIKNNKSLIDGITTSKVNVADIIDNLTTNVTNKPLSAAQGVALKELINELKTGSITEIVTPQDYGAVGDGVTNDANALQAMIDDALAQKKRIVFPHGRTYVCNAPLVVNMDAAKPSFALDGNQCKVYFNDCDGVIFKNNDRTSAQPAWKNIHMENLIIDGNMQDTTVALSLGDDELGFDSVYDYLTFQHMSLHNHGVAMKLTNTRKCHFFDIDFGSTTGNTNQKYGVVIRTANDGTNIQFSGDIMFTNCEILGVSACVTCERGGSEDVMNEIRGVHFTACQFYGIDKAILLTTLGVRKLDWFFNQCQFDQFNGNLFELQGQSNQYSLCGNFVISGCYMIKADRVLKCIGTYKILLASCVIDNINCLLDLWNCQEFTINGNQIDGMVETSIINGDTIDKVHDFSIVGNIVNDVDTNIPLFTVFIGTRFNIQSNILKSISVCRIVNLETITDSVIANNIYPGKTNTLTDYVQ